MTPTQRATEQISKIIDSAELVCYIQFISKRWRDEFFEMTDIGRDFLELYVVRASEPYDVTVVRTNVAEPRPMTRYSFRLFAF